MHTNTLLNSLVLAHRDYASVVWAMAMRYPDKTCISATEKSSMNIKSANRFSQTKPLFDKLHWIALGASDRNN